MAACKCDSSLKNTGIECSPLMAYSQKMIIVPRFGDDGITENYIDLTDTLDQAYFTALINNANTKDRWYPLPLHKNPTSERGEDVYETFDDNSKQFVTEGVRTNTIIITGKSASPKLVEKLKAFKCAEIGIYIVDKNRSLIGSSHGESAKMYPIIVDENTWSVRYVFPTSTTAGQIMISFDWIQDERDEDLIMITGEELSPVNPIKFEGLLDVSVTISNISTTGFKAVLATEFGTALNPILVEGLINSDFVSSVTGTTSKLRNSTDSADIAVATVTESPAGTYTFTYLAQTSADVLIMKPKKNGYDFTAVEAKTILIP